MNFFILFLSSREVDGQSGLQMLYKAVRPSIAYHQSNRFDWKYYNENGTSRYILEYNESPTNGYFTCLFKDKAICRKSIFKDGKQVGGNLNVRNAAKEIVKIIEFKDGEVVKRIDMKK